MQLMLKWMPTDKQSYVRLNNIDWVKLWDMYKYTGAVLFKSQRYRTWLVV